MLTSHVGKWQTVDYKTMYNSCGYAGLGVPPHRGGSSQYG